MMYWVKEKLKATHKKDKEHAKALSEGRLYGYSLHPMKELCWLVLDLIQFLTFSDEMHM